MYSIVVMLALSGAPEVAGCHHGYCYGYGYSSCCYPTAVWYYQPTYYCCEPIACCAPVTTESAKEKDKEEKEDKEEMDKADDGEEGQSISKSSSASVLVTLPAPAKLIVEDQVMTSTGTSRVFTTPALKGGKRYAYTMTAVVVRDGQLVRQTRKVFVESGKKTAVTFDFASR